MDDVNMGNISPYEEQIVDGKLKKETTSFKEGEDYVDA